MSYNNFSYINCCELAPSLEKNRTIYGIHFMGNSGYIDTRGFLIPEKINSSNDKPLIKRINGVKMVKQKQLKGFNETREVCWICQGWRQIDVRWHRILSPEKEQPENVFIHFCFDNYQQIYLGTNYQNQALNYSRMIPPGEINYFFSDHIEQFFTAQDIQTVKNLEPFENIQTYDKVIKEVFLYRIHRSIDFPNKQIINKQMNYYPTIKILPRTPEQIYTPPKEAKKVYKWKFPLSLFAKWRQDDAELINLCFNYDWECSKVIFQAKQVTKVVKDPDQQAEVKKFFRERYKIIKDAYKFYSCQNPVSDVWSIQTPSFLEFLNKCNIIDQKVQIEFLTIKWTAVLSGAKGLALTPASEILQQPQLKESIYNHDCQFVDNRQYTFLQKTIINLTRAIKEENERQENVHSSESSDHSPDASQLPSPKPSSSNISKGQTTPTTKIRRQSLVRAIASVKHSNTASHLKFLEQPQKNNQFSTYIQQLSTFTVDPFTLQANKNFRNPERGVNRYQFMELLLRISEEKYIQQYKKTQSYSDAIKMLWDDNLLREFCDPRYDTQLWRTQRYWVEDVDLCLRHYKKIIDHVYKKNAMKKVKPGQQPFMCLDEFNSVITQCGLLEIEEFGSNIYLYAFNNSMMTQIDELCVDRIFQMSIVEFYEAISRLAEEACLQPLKDTNTDPPANHRKSIKDQVPLAYKLEGLIQRLYTYCCDAAFKQNISFPSTSLFSQQNEDIRQQILKDIQN